MKISIPDMIIGYCVGMLVTSLMLAHKVNKGSKNVTNLVTNFDNKCDQFEQKMEGDSHE